MPLTKSASKAAFSKNVKTEMGAGRPQKQAVAIAFATQRKAKQDHSHLAKHHAKRNGY